MSSVIFGLLGLIAVSLAAHCQPFLKTDPAFVVDSFVVEDYSTLFTTVTFPVEFATVPIVVATTSVPGDELAQLRIRAVTTTGFEAIVVAPTNSTTPVLGGTIPYFAMERGRVTVSGMVIEAGAVETEAWKSRDLGFFDQFAFSAPFAHPPKVLAYIQTMNSETANVAFNNTNPFLSTAITERTADGFKLALERGETLLGDPADAPAQPETVGYIAIDGKASNVDSCRVCNAATGMAPMLTGLAPYVRGRPATALNLTGYTDGVNAPLVIGAMNSRNGENGGWLRLDNVTATDVMAFVEEDHAFDNDSYHSPEKLGLLVASTALRSNVAPELSLSVANAAEGSNVTLSVSVSDAAANEQYTLTIEWGDSTSETQTFNSTGAITVVELEHFYADNTMPGNPYIVHVYVTDLCGASSESSIPLTIVNVPPTIAFSAIGCESATVRLCSALGKRGVTPVAPIVTCTRNEEGAPFELTGELVDPGVNDPLAVKVWWGDGSALLSQDFAGSETGRQEFSFSHVYKQSNEEGFPYLLRVSVADECSATDYCIDINVANVPPTIVDLAPGNPAAVAEGALATVFKFKATDDGAMTYSVAWGDDTESEATPLLHPKQSVSHQYADNGVYTAVLSVFDANGDASELNKTVEVYNVAPQFINTYLKTVASGTVAFTSTAYDAGQDSQHVTFHWSDGVVETADYDAVPQDIAVWHRFAPKPQTNPYNGTLRATLTDDDGGVTVIEKAVELTYTDFTPLLKVHAKAEGGGRVTVMVTNQNDRGIDADNVFVDIDLSAFAKALVYEAGSERGRVLRAEDGKARWPVGRLHAMQYAKLVLYVEEQRWGDNVFGASIDANSVKTCLHADVDCTLGFDVVGSTLFTAVTVNY